MPENRRARNKIIWATILFTLVLMPPMLSIFNKPVLAGGIPILFVYIFIAWLLYVVFTAWHSRKTNN
jgi:hypothetical protein